MHRDSWVTPASTLLNLTAKALLEPLDDLHEPSARARARWTAAFLLIVSAVWALVAFGGSLMTRLGMVDDVRMWERLTSVLVYVVVPLCIQYALARAGYYRSAALLYILVGPLAALYLFAALNDPHAVMLLDGFVASLVVSAYLFSVRASLINFVYIAACMLLIPLVAPAVSPGHLVEPLLVNGLALTLLVYTQAGRQRQEAAASSSDTFRCERAVLEHAADAALLLDTKDVIVEVYGQGCEQAPSRADAVGGQALAFVHPDDQAAFSELLARVREGKPAQLSQARIRGQGERYHRFQLWFVPRLKAGIYDGAVVFARLVATEAAADADKQRITAELQQTRQHVEMLVAQMPVAVIEWDLERRINRWNPAATTIFGYTAAEAMGREAIDLLVPEHERAHVRDIFERILHTDDPAYSVNENLTKDGRMIWVEWVNIPLIDGGGRKIGLASLAQDVTERRRAEERAMQLMVAEDRLTAMRALVRVIAHFFRNHLAQIEVNRHLIARLVTQGKHEDVLKRLAALQRGIDQIGGQLDNLAAIASAANPDLTKCDLVALVGQAARNRQEHARTREVTLTVATPAARVELLADAQRVREALEQLLQMAIARASAHTTLTLSLTATDTTACIALADEGATLSTEQIRLLHAFFHTPQAVRAAEISGDLLALIIAQLVAETHGGKMQVEPAATGGSQITLMLPLSPAQAA
jgi:PAS domain S-box-containing protein